MRFGGRSARIQSAVHQAVKTLAANNRREELTVPQIAAEAGVTPSTIYRRWGDLSALLADVATECLRPISDPDDADFIMRNTRNCHGFYGASSMERLPVERALTDQVRKFKAIGAR